MSHIDSVNELEQLGLKPDDALRLSGWELIEQLRGHLDDVEIESMCEIHRRYREVLEPRVEREACRYSSFNSWGAFRGYQEGIAQRLRSLLACGVAMSLEEERPAPKGVEQLTERQIKDVIGTLRELFMSETEGQYVRQEGMDFNNIERALRDAELNPHALWSLSRMQEIEAYPDLLAETPDAYVIGECFHCQTIFDSSPAHDRVRNSYQHALQQAGELGVGLMGSWTYNFAFRHSGFWEGFEFLRTSKKLQDETTYIRGMLDGLGTQTIELSDLSPISTGPYIGWRGELLVKKHPKVQQ
ncbi:MAG: hypothetical protein WCS85_04565 [Candidatus Peribacteraceae bacterium]|jgi:hypothetical protein